MRFKQKYRPKYIFWKLKKSRIVEGPEPPLASGGWGVGFPSYATEIGCLGRSPDSSP